MKIITIQNIIDINKLFENNKLAYKIHLRDACGKQSMWIETIGDTKHMEEVETLKIPSQLYELIEDYFEKEKIQLAYDQDRINFWVAN